MKCESTYLLRSVSQITILVKRYIKAADKYSI